jgi:hypothetical protein
VPRRKKTVTVGSSREVDAYIAKAPKEAQGKLVRARMEKNRQKRG